MDEDFSPQIIVLPKSERNGGTLSFLEEGENLLFNIRRIYWIYGISRETERGNHCHEFSHRIIISLQGSTKIELEDLYKEKFSFELTEPNQALYVPPKHWIKLSLSKSSIVLSCSSHLFEEDNTITDYEDFLALGQF